MTLRFPLTLLLTLLLTGISRGSTGSTIIDSLTGTNVSSEQVSKETQKGAMTKVASAAETVPESNRYSVALDVSFRVANEESGTAIASVVNSQPSSHIANYVWMVLIACVVVAVVRRFPSCRSWRLHWAFAASFTVACIPVEIFSSIGILGIIVSTVCVIHLLVPRAARGNAIFVGIGLAFFAYAFAVAGVLVIHTEMPFVERYSTAFYEATQLPLMNMSVHDDTTISAEARAYFTIARSLASLLALYLTYKTVLYFLNLASTQFWMLCYRFNREKKLSLVIGIGSVGLELIRDLRLQGHRVIAVEINKDAPRVEEARMLGARIVIGDAVDFDLYRQLPFDAIDSVYVVAGDDQRNIEISQRLRNFSAQRVAMGPRKTSDRSNPPLRNSLRGRIDYLRWRCRLQNHPGVCYVQLYDVSMQRILEQEHHDQPLEKFDIEMRHFNANRNAVRDFIQRQLSAAEVRPQKTDEVALYLVVGFDHLGQELAAELAQLAHFNNHRRSRIVVFSETPEKDCRTFLARYPKFSDDRIIKDWKDVKFKTEEDSWSFLPTPGTVAEGEVSPAQSTADRLGIQFATNAIFTNAPVSPAELAFHTLIHNLTTTVEGVVVKPVLIVCEPEWKRSFAWSSEFCESWKSYCRRMNLSPFVPSGRCHPELPVYFWLQGHRAIRELVRDNRYQIPFGLEEHSISKSLVDAELLSHLGAVVQYSYDLVMGKISSTEPPESLRPLSYADLKSNLNGAAHALIKFQLAGCDISWLSEQHSMELPSLTEVPSFVLNGVTLTDMTTFDRNDQSIVAILAQTEHNRWMAEQLMKGYEWINTEPARDASGDRLPQYLHFRTTLCPWNQLPAAEALKDVRQTYYVLCHLQRLQAALQRNESQNTGTR